MDDLQTTMDNCIIILIKQTKQNQIKEHVEPFNVLVYSTYMYGQCASISRSSISPRRINEKHYIFLCYLLFLSIIAWMSSLMFLCT